MRRKGACHSDDSGQLSSVQQKEQIRPGLEEEARCALQQLRVDAATYTVVQSWRLLSDGKPLHGAELSAGNT